LEAHVEPDEIIRRYRERRLITLALADQVAENRWREPALPAGWTIHDLLTHLIGWDEWAAAVFDLSLIRDELPPVVIDAIGDPDAYNERSVARMHNLTRDDVMTALQEANPRVLKSAMAAGGELWPKRRIPLLPRSNFLAAHPDPAGLDPARADAPRPPSVGGILRILVSHEAEHDQELMDAFAIQPHLERLGGPPDDAAPQGNS
jgi:hypothetical protein